MEKLLKNPNASEIDNLLFNELMNMINGDLALTRYIAQNVLKVQLGNVAKTKQAK